METTFISPNLWPALPEMFLLGMACVILVADLFFSDKQRVFTHWLSLGTLAGTVLILGAQIDNPDIVTFSGMYVADGMAIVLKLVACATTAAVLVYSRDYLKSRQLFQGEFYVLILGALLGAMVMISGLNFVSLYLGLELLSLSSYGLVALRRDDGVASEAAMKYFVLGAIASGLLLYGMSILYGISGTLDVLELAAWASGAELSAGLLLALVFVIIGMAFKLGAVPFHMWIPDVYEGAPTAVTLFLGTVPKLAAFALFMRLLVEGLGAMHSAWQAIIVALALLSMFIGSVVAIAQTSLKRMLAYSTISHVGFLLMGILAGTAQGYQAAMFYTITYVIMAAAGFGMILLLARSGFEADKLDDFAGLNRRSPWFAAMMMFVMFGMAGVPPFVGFYAKFAVIWAALEAGFTWLAVAAVVLSVVSAFYYLRLVKIMYFDEPVDDAGELEVAADSRLVMSVNGLLILGLGIFPGGLMAVCISAIS
ncbi:MAG TPA: NADH-quinone oxidoreductase subunit NuoN [Gammaproteobacteria bacterium]